MRNLALFLFNSTILIFLCFTFSLSANDSVPKRPVRNLAADLEPQLYRPNIFIYSESTYFPKDSNVVFASKLYYTFFRYQNLTNFYLGFEQGQDFQSKGNTIYNDNHIAPLVGANFRPLPIPVSLFTEYRRNFRLFRKPTTRETEEPDFRMGGFAYQWFDLIRFNQKVRPFTEMYAEAVYSSMLDKNLLMAGWTKAGVRIPLSSKVFADGYTELSFSRDRLRLLENNFEMSGLGARMGIKFDSVLAQMMIRRNFELFSTFPGNQSRWNGQLVFVAEI